LERLVKRLCSLRIGGVELCVTLWVRPQVELEFRLNTQPTAPVTLAFEAAMPGGYTIIALPGDAQLEAFLEASRGSSSNFTSQSASLVQTAPVELTYTGSTWATFSPLSLAVSHLPSVARNCFLYT
jgi:hypothetical protein